MSTDAENVCVSPYLYEGRAIRRAGARDLDRLAVGPVHGAITITGSCLETHMSHRELFVGVQGLTGWVNTS
jgi:hypothetical protein